MTNTKNILKSITNKQNALNIWRLKNIALDGNITIVNILNTI